MKNVLSQNVKRSSDQTEKDIYFIHTLVEIVAEKNAKDVLDAIEYAMENSAIYVLEHKQLEK